MIISAISFENYKPFGNKERIVVKPLTIFIGRNSSGKSAIARLLILLARALSEKAESAVELSFDEVDFGDTFLDLIHNRIPHGAIGFGLAIKDDDGNEEEFWLKLQHFDEYKMLIVSSFQYRYKTGSISLEWIGKDPIKDPKSYNIAELKCTCDVDFIGIWPSSIKHKSPYGASEKSLKSAIKTTETVLTLAKTGFQEATKEITYLGPFREAPERTYRFPGGGVKNVGYRGKKAPDLLGDDFLRKEGALVGSVGNWFGENLGGWQLGISRQGDRFALVMRNPEEPSLEVNVVDVGTGIAQVLPIVVQRQLDLSLGDCRRIEIVEQPELHLHPGAHGSVADLYLASLCNPGSQFIVETHSENFLLRVRRRIAERTVDNDKVAIYWFDGEGVEDQIVHITVDKNGDVDRWPAKVFSEDLGEVVAIRNAQRGHCVES